MEEEAAGLCEFVLLVVCIACCTCRSRSRLYLRSREQTNATSVETYGTLVARSPTIESPSVNVSVIGCFISCHDRITMSTGRSLVSRLTTRACREPAFTRLDSLE